MGDGGLDRCLEPGVRTRLILAKSSVFDCKPSLLCSCRSHEWQQMSRTDREKMGLVVRDVGEFWCDISCSYPGRPARRTSECLSPSGWTSRISVTISRMWWCAGLWRGFCCGPDLTGGRSTSTGSGLQLRHLVLLRRGTAWRPDLRREEEAVNGTARLRRREGGRQRWIRGADVEVASTTGTRSCTILR